MESKQLMSIALGLILIAIGVVIGATVLSPAITALVAADSITGLDSSAAALLPVAQLVTVVALTIGPPLVGMFIIFKAVKN
jgi:hypothetical protein